MTKSTRDQDVGGIRRQIVDNQEVIDELNRQLERKTNEVTIIQQISSEINSTLDLRAVLDLILAAMDRVLGFGHGMILLADSDESLLTLAACRGYENAEIGAEIAVGQGVPGVVAKRRKMMRIGNLKSQMRYMASVRARMDGDARPTGTADVPALPGLPDAQSQIAIPLVVKERLIGVFVVESAEANFFDELDEVLVSIVANQIANAIDNARLHQSEIDRSAERDRAIAELSRVNDTLEARVRERTEELSGLVEALRTEKERSENLLGRMMPPELIPLMLENRLEPRRVTTSVLFADLVGFTSFTSGMEPDEIFARLNRYFGWSGETIRRFRGYLNKTNGDGVMALFGVPDGSPSHAIDAVLTALFLQRDVREHIPLGMRAGICSGPITTGLLGPADRNAYDALGDTINAASRMEAIGAPEAITITRTTYDLVHPYFTIEPLGEQDVKGLVAVDCFRVLDLKPLLADTRRVDQSSRFAGEHEGAITTMETVRDDDLAVVNFISVQSRDGALGHNGAVAAFALALLRMLRNPQNAEGALSTVSEPLLIKTALLHDIGKHAISPSDLNATNLGADARDRLRDRLEAETIKALERLNLGDAIPIIKALYQFERRGGAELAKDPIVEILALADIYDALTAPKLYKGASWRIGGALEELLRLPCYGRGETPAVRAFVELMKPANEGIRTRKAVEVLLE